MNSSMSILLAATQTAPSPAAKAVAIALVAVVFLVALRAAIRHFKGEGGCCGGAAEPPPEQDKVIGAVAARRELTLAGLHCMKCVARVQRALDALPGVAADVTLDPQRALVRMDRAVPDETLRKAVEDEGFQVLEIKGV